jgi:zinc/manganese transport system substrate-binding protein
LTSFRLPRHAVPVGASRPSVLLGSVLGLIAIPLLTACSDDASGSSDTAGVTVVASTNVYADIATVVGGNLVQASSFISSPDQDPHSYEANTRNIVTVSNADVVIENGGGYDDFMDQLLDGASGDPIVLDVVDISGHAAPAGGELNEHVWYDFPTIQKLATQLADALGQADSEHASTYRDNAETFNADVQKLIDRESALARTVGGDPVGITEPVPGYLLDALGLENLTPGAFSEAIEEGEDVSVSVLDQTLSLYSDHQVDALVYNEQTSGPITEQVKQEAEDAGIPVVPVTETLPDGETYVTWMKSNLDRLRQALTAS